MKKVFIILTSLLTVFILLIIFNPPEVIVESNVSSPQKPESVPNTALWAGGIDGGNFIFVETYKDEDKLFFARIYNDFTGEIEYEGLVKYNGSKDLTNLLNNQSFYRGWDGDSLHLIDGEIMTMHSNKKLTSH
jgi:methylase of polypeptide subunit release factors